MYILREDFSIAYPTIGQKLGGRDHTTVIHSYEKIKGELKTDSELVQQLVQIRTMIQTVFKIVYNYVNRCVNKFWISL